MSSHRKCPIPYTDAPRGTCRWCNDPILYGEKRNNRARWHGGCLAQYNLHIIREVQLRWLHEQSPLCRCCGKAVPQWSASFNGWRDGPYVSVFRKLGGEVDHIIPLWKTVGMTDEQRLKYFGPENLQLLCRACHAEKTAREATERAHQTRLRKSKKVTPAKGEGSLSSRPKSRLQSRGFDKTLRRRMNGTVERRKK